MSWFRRKLMTLGGEVNYTLMPLTFEAITGGDLSIRNDNNSDIVYAARDFEYSLNNGAWVSFSLPAGSSQTKIATLSAGDKIRFRRDGVNFNGAKFVSDSSLTFDMYGNLLSLQYGSAFNGQTSLRDLTAEAFWGVFYGVNVVDASNLVLAATALSPSCYRDLFQWCSLLTSAPSERPATTLADNCYRAMFAHCQSLVNVPAILPATTLAERCYQYMFLNCSSLVTAPEIAATTLATYCCNQMFQGCSSLANAPSELSAASLDANYCYQNMFRYCYSLVTAPDILATSVTGSNACGRMFSDCSSLNYVKCLLTPDSALMRYWLSNVAGVGTFVKAQGTTWEAGYHGIPSGWTVEEVTI